MLASEAPIYDLAAYRLRHEQAEAPKSVLARDLYSMADFEVEAKRLLDGREQIEHDDWETEPDINSRTGIFEELTAKGHLSRIEFEDEVDVINQRTLKRLLNGYSNKLPEWEKNRRFHEIVEELIVHRAWQDIKDGKLSLDTIILTISDCPEEASLDWGHTFGYRALNRKGMIRSHTFEMREDGQINRVLEQISRSNSNDGTSKQFINFAARIDLDSGLSQTVLSNQLVLSRKQFPNGVVDIQRILDSFAGPSVRYGEQNGIKDPRLPVYEELGEVSRQREEQAEHFIKEFADYEREINIQYKDDKISYDDKLVRLQQKRKNIVDRICVMDPGYAKDARGEEAAGLWEKASLSMAAGNDSAGVAYLEQAMAAADPRAGVACGDVSNTNVSRPGTTEAERTYAQAKVDRKYWTWQKGYCIVGDGCRNQGEKIDVGPCSVCRDCQHLYDIGKNPKHYAVADFFKRSVMLFQVTKVPLALLGKGFFA
jgi:hypothetical protein